MKFALTLLISFILTSGAFAQNVTATEHSSRSPRTAEERVKRIAWSLDQATRDLAFLADRDAAYGYNRYTQDSAVDRLRDLSESAINFHEAVRENCCRSPRIVDVEFYRLERDYREAREIVDFARFSNRTKRAWCEVERLMRRLSYFLSAVRADEGRYPDNDRSFDRDEDDSYRDDARPAPQLPNDRG